MEDSPTSAVEELLHQRQPIHFGGMSDPFPRREAQDRITLDILQLLSARRYPTVLSTKSDLFASDEYLDVLKSGRFIIQVSITSLDEELSRSVERGTAGPRSLLNAAALAIEEGIPVACRIQPVLPTREADAFNVIQACADIGVRHVAVEHLKLPIERNWEGTKRLSEELGLDLFEYFAGASRVGREWILPVEERLPRVLALRSEAHRRGLSFGAADNDLLILSDGSCCCSGADMVAGFQNYFMHTYTEAVRRGMGENHITLGSLEGVWCPSRSVAEFVNSRSRLPDGASIRRYIETNWNGSPNGSSPASLYGVLASGEYDETGKVIYTLSEDVRRLASVRTRHVRGGR